MSSQERLHALDSVRAFALLMGVALHATMSFIPGLPPGIWATVDSSPSIALGQLFFVTHIFRMSLFFVIAGFFARFLHQRARLRGFWINRVRRIVVPLIVGWCILCPSIALVWVWGLTRYFGGHMPVPPASMRSPPGYFPLTHLWFLYYLVLLYPVILGLRGGVSALDRTGRLRARLDALMRSVLGGWAGLAVAPLMLGGPLAIVLYLSPAWHYWSGVPTPDSSLIPQLPALLGYGVAMMVGWMLHRQSMLLQFLERWWGGHLILAVAATVYCSSVAGSRINLMPTPPGGAKALFAAAYVFAMWSWVFAILGAAVHFLSRQSPVRRYLADSSYWLYLTHLPVVAAFAVIVAPWPLHWSVKFPLVLGATLAVLLLSYHFLVRPTVIGEWLNGRRYPIGRPGRMRAQQAG
jgi:peptidoglycan/LPS O-acetylase OafA/YrhL